MWTLFWDMHSRTKEGSYDKIYIEATKDEAVVIFYNRFGHNPHRITCTCCGEDYSVDEEKTFGKASEYHRKGSWGEGKINQTIAQYKKNKNVLVIPKSEILANERVGEVPDQGYVWV